MNREAIYSALFALVNTSAMQKANGGQFNTITRRPQLWNQYNSADMPVLGMVEIRETYQWPSGSATPAKATLKGEFWIYTNIGEDKNVIPSTLLNNCIDTVEASIQPSPPRPLARQTLGGLVAECVFDGEIMKAPGYTDGIGMAVIPFTIIVPA